MGCTVAVDLVAEDGRAQLLLFGTGDSRHVGVFKNESWAVDEFAGIRYRDPRDGGRSLVDISLRPAAGAVARQPEKGRLTPRTVVGGR